MPVSVATESEKAKEPGDIELLERAASASKSLREAIAAKVVGQGTVVDAMLVALLARGHALLVGVPGLAKTLLVSSLAEALDLSFGRVQFTPDLLPADITGTDVLQEEEDEKGTLRRRVRFLSGPIFHNLVLADEINRTPPKTQAALLQAMQERRVTVGTTTHKLPDPFQVFATRNPIEQEGTYPLPEAQLDRFLLEIHVEYPSEIERARNRASHDEREGGRDPARPQRERRARIAGAGAADSRHGRSGEIRGVTRARDSARSVRVRANRKRSSRIRAFWCGSARLAGAGPRGESARGASR